MEWLTKLKNYADLLTQNNISFVENEPLSLHSTFKIGGAARIFVIPSTSEELAIAVKGAKQFGIRTFIAGKGSNLVYPDKGFDGAVISTLSMNSVVVDGCRIIADAGVSVTELAVIAAKNSLTGLEFAYGIPGSLGGAVYMNAGAYDGDMCGVITSSRYYDTENDSFGTFVGGTHCFGYRESIYKKNPGYIVLSVTLTLAKGDKSQIESKMSDLLSRRKDKQPLEYPSAGSSFKRYPGRYTAQMIDEAGLKGFTVGGAQVSEKHAGFIINIGGATADDVKRLSDVIKEKIFELHGIKIENEIIFVE